jgi:hypothetical protein
MLQQTRRILPRFPIILLYLENIGDGEFVFIGKGIRVLGRTSNSSSFFPSWEEFRTNWKIRHRS